VVRTRFSKVLALVLVFVMVMSSGTSALAYTVISNVLTATVTVTANPVAEALADVNALNITQVEHDTGHAMQAALENTDLGLDLTEYEKLTEGGRREAVADYVSFTKVAKGNFINVAAVQSALNTGVQIEMHKMNFIQLLSGSSLTLDNVIAAILADNQNYTKNFSKTQIDAFYGPNYGYDAIVAQNALLNSYVGLSEANKLKVTNLFLSNPYNGSYITVLNYLKAAIDAVSAVPVVTLQWKSGGTITDNNLVIENTFVGNSRTISFEAATNKDVSNIGYVITSNKYITINGATALKHYIDSETLSVSSPEAITINVRFEAIGDYNLTVEAVTQEDTDSVLISSPSAIVTTNNGSPRIELGFSLSEEIDLSQDKLGNIIISYGKMEGTNFVETLRSDGTPIVKSKTWSGYLNLGATTTKYCSGAENNSAYVNIVPADQFITTVVDPNYTTMGYANDAEWIADVLDGNVAVKVIVIDNEGNFSEQLITAK
jgi:hypothetical protein